MARTNGVTLDKIMKMDCMDKCKIIAGMKGIKNTVSNVNVMADPDIINWVGEGELLLTTAYSFKTSSLNEQRDFIRQCAEKKLSALGIKIYPYLEKLPEETLALADQLGLPIIELYYEIPFSDIMTPVFKEIFNKQALLLQKLENIYERLMDVMLKGGDLESVAKTVNDNLKNPVMIKLDFPTNEVFHAGYIENQTREDLIQNAERFFDPNLERYKERKLYESKEEIGEIYVDRMVMPIVVKNSVFGHIFAWGLSTPLGGFDLSVLEATATTMSLDMLRKLSVKEVENRYKAEFFEELVSLEAYRREKALEKAPMFSLDPEKDYLSIIVNFDSRKGQSNDFMEDDMGRVLNLSERLLEEYRIEGVVVNKTDSFILVLSFGKKDKRDRKIEGIKTHLEKAIKLQSISVDIHVGVGRIYTGMENFHKSFKDSLKAMRISKVNREVSIVSYQSLGVFKILSQDHLDEELEKFYDETLKPLVAYDQKKSTELVKTLEAYFKFNGNFKKISNELFAHYNTILYRMQRIKEVTGMNLEDFDDRLNLEIAVKIKKLLGK
ncbi:PucR family transcriptional regulator [Isachenkonia alkalipeptolytica]|uniref:PucR family transcriptional regulator n=1 Tax=Isachenkonia alkalipeptolytica TaxID=2565777 RepID=A0AA44BFT5_9CLOT|nr:PucR family transcriptional regulator [Isachenkonia alkalipeptolytica]NBG88811.1 PucR family transcriptional regulator [Isachenkonia alkalipeptolytica]